MKSKSSWGGYQGSFPSMEPFPRTPSPRAQAWKKSWRRKSPLSSTFPSCPPHAAPEDYLYSHAVNVSLLSLALATKTGYSEAQVLDIAVASLLLDIGMERVPKQIRDKTGSLSDAEIYEV